MGFFGGGTPAPDPELEKQRAEEKARAEKEKKEEEARKREADRVRRANLVGQRALQDEDIQGFSGFRRMGKNKSIRY